MNTNHMYFSLLLLAASSAIFTAPKKTLSKKHQEAQTAAAAATGAPTVMQADDRVDDDDPHTDQADDPSSRRLIDDQFPAGLEVTGDVSSFERIPDAQDMATEETSHSLRRQAQELLRKSAEMWTTVAHSLGIYSATACLPRDEKDIYQHIAKLNSEEDRKGTDLLIKAIRETSKTRSTSALNTLLAVCEEIGAIGELGATEKRLIQQHYASSTERQADEFKEMASDLVRSAASNARFHRLTTGSTTPPAEEKDLSSMVNLATSEFVARSSAGRFTYPAITDDK